MADQAQNGVGVQNVKRRCFVVSAFGSNQEEKRRHKQVLRHLVQKVLGERFRVIRADEIDDEGLITNQIIEHLIDDDLVVADLTGLNPNVFYEVAVRHAVRKPIVHLITSGQEIPFDVANMRAVPYALDDPDALEVAQAELDRKVMAIEENDWKAAPNPISAARDVWLLQESEQPELREAGALLAAMGEVRDEVRALGRRVPPAEESPGFRVRGPLLRALVSEVSENDPIAEGALMARFPEVSTGEFVRAIQKLLNDKQLHVVDGKLSTIPF
jgi:hypothetical protein